MAQIARVCLIGPHSTGKSTLARELAAHYATEWVPEYARTLLESNIVRSIETFDLQPRDLSIDLSFAPNALVL